MTAQEYADMVNSGNAPWLSTKGRNDWTDSSKEQYFNFLTAEQANDLELERWRLNNEYNTPIYEVSESHIKKILADPEFMSQIREKFFITLSLDEDNYYLVIALIMAYLYHQNGYSDGYSAQDIFDVGNDLDIKKISNLEISKISAFMEELEELNVFRKTDNSHFLFTRFTFFQMMGTGSEVEDKLANFMEA